MASSRLRSNRVPLIPGAYFPMPADFKRMRYDKTMALFSDGDAFIPATPMTFPHPASEREILLPEEKQSCSTWVALRGYAFAITVFAMSVLLAGAVIVETKPAMPDPEIDSPRAKNAAIRALLDTTFARTSESQQNTALCIYGDRDVSVRESMRNAFPAHASTTLAEDCDLRARTNKQTPLWLHVGRVSWPNRSYAVVVFAAHGRGEIILHKVDDGFEVHKITWPVR